MSDTSRFYRSWSAPSPDGAQKPHEFANEDVGEGATAFKGQRSFMEGFAALGSVPCVDELARALVFHRAADREFHIAHWTPREAHCIPGLKIETWATRPIV